MTNDAYWGIIWVDREDPDNWQLLDQSISLQLVLSIEAAEEVYGDGWENLRKGGFYLVRLRLTSDGKPSNITFAWAERDKPEATGIMSYEENAKKVREKAIASIEKGSTTR